MKKTVTIALAAVIVLGGSIAINHGYAQEDQAKKKVEINSKYIGIEKAKTIALEKVDGTVKSVELESDDGQTYYEVDIEQNSKDFDIDVDAATGKIIKVDEEQADDNDNNDHEDDVETHEATNSNQPLLSEKEAIEIAKKKITGKLVEIELDEDDGRYEYEMEFDTSDGERDITIDAVTGEVLELEQ
ncbi:putative membrane protein YkoI [Metabacillus crassostreae]|uniref:PepSY domain-containing protein n=1 Tax=Metabacillus crassostreae TaxID=929098 RepID=UPI00195DE0CF|nr:PepSY domain-containing protein [Metabacillus crassostreae]MBM7606327.1 putative membrane protein YkoI [Metabacillus crassostreae]